jgi:hypothetical protein
VTSELNHTFHFRGGENVVATQLKAVEAIFSSPPTPSPSVERGLLYALPHPWGRDRGWGGLSMEAIIAEERHYAAVCT